jgi:hypothetical protein
MGHPLGINVLPDLCHGTLHVADEWQTNKQEAKKHAVTSVVDLKGSFLFYRLNKRHAL